LNHIPMPCVNNLSQKLIDDKGSVILGSRRSSSLIF
jgi:hypothetical protein